MITGPSATGLPGSSDLLYCIGATIVFTPQGDGSYWESGITYVLRFAAARMGLLVAACKVCCLTMEQKIGMLCLSLALLGCGHIAAMHCFGQVLGDPELEKRTDQNEDYLAHYVEMDGRGIALCRALPSFPKDEFFAVHCKGIEMIKMEVGT